MAKANVGVTMVLEWTPSGSTTITAFQALARNLELSQTMDTADATGYTNTNRQYVGTIQDAELSFELFLDDTTYTTEDLFQNGNKGTIDIYPYGKTTGKRKISFPGLVNDASESYPYDDVAMKNVALVPTGNVTRSVVV